MFKQLTCQKKLDIKEKIKAIDAMLPGEDFFVLRKAKCKGGVP